MAAQADNDRVLAGKVDKLQQTVASHLQRIAELEKENAELRRTVGAGHKEEAYRTHNSMAFKRKSNGKFSDQPYCPHCYKLMSVVEGFMINCRPCSHVVTLGNERLPEIAKWLDENPE